MNSKKYFAEYEDFWALCNLPLNQSRVAINSLRSSFFISPLPKDARAQPFFCPQQILPFSPFAFLQKLSCFLFEQRMFFCFEKDILKTCEFRKYHRQKRVDNLFPRCSQFLLHQMFATRAVRKQLKRFH